ncbi:unnamed protein product, partial [Chrysoparadoxa australica]
PSSLRQNLTSASGGSMKSLLVPSAAVAVFLSSCYSPAHAFGLVMQASTPTFPSFIAPEIANIREQAALDIASRMKRVSVDVPDWVSEAPVQTAYVSSGKAARGAAPLLFLHGFDSSVMEWRRLLPELSGQEAWAVDILGWGFGDHEAVASFSAESKIAHLHAFWSQAMKGRPMVLVGASLGGGIAVDFAHRYPEAVEKLVLVDGQCLLDGSGPIGSLPPPLARWGIKLLGSKPLRRMANKMAYSDESFATEDAMLVGHLHVLQPRWEAAAIDFMCTGGFAVSEKVASVQAETLVLWGREDKILEPGLYAEKLVEVLPNARLEWVEQCGHCPHLEQPSITAALIKAHIA